MYRAKAAGRNAVMENGLTRMGTKGSDSVTGSNPKTGGHGR